MHPRNQHSHPCSRHLLMRMRSHPQLKKKACGRASTSALAATRQTLAATAARLSISLFPENLSIRTGDHLYVELKPLFVAPPLTAIALQDITARSPIPQNDFPARQSLDSARFPRLPRSALDRHRELPTADEGFEDVGLDDQKHQQQHHQSSRMRGLFSRFGDSDHKEPSANSPNSSVTRFLNGAGRKRGQSGQGSELGTIERPKSAASVETTEIH